MEPWQVFLFNRFCVGCAVNGCLTINDENLLSLYEECVAVAYQQNDIVIQGFTYSILGELCVKNHQLHKAIEYYKKQLNLAVKMGNREAGGSCYYHLGRVFLSLEKYKKAIEYQQRSLDIALEIGDKDGEYEIYRCLGYAYHKLKEYDFAKTYHEKALDIALEIGDKDMERACYDDSGRFFYSFGKYDQAIKYHQRSLDIDVVKGDKKRECETSRSLGDAYIRLGKYDLAKKHYEKALDIALEMGYKDMERNCYVDLGRFFYSLGKYQKAIEFHKRGLDIALKTGDGKGPYMDLGYVYQKLGKSDTAKMYYEKALDIAIKMKNRRGEGVANGNIGSIYAKLGECPKAIEYHQKAIAIALEIGDQEVESDAYNDLAARYLSMKEFDKSMEFQEKGLRIARELGDKLKEGMFYGNIARIFHAQKRCHEAIEFYQKSLDSSIEFDDRDGQGRAHFHIGGCYLLLAGLEESKCFSHFKEAEDHYTKSLKYYESLFNDLEESDEHKIAIVDTYVKVYRALTFVKAEMGQTDEALFVSERSKARALNDLLAMKYSLAKPATTSEGSPLQVSDIERILTSANTGVLFYALYEAKVTKSSTHMWALLPQSPFHYQQREIKGLHQTSENSPPLENHPDNISDDIFSALIEKSYDMMKVREGMVCEDRSLEISEDEEDGQSSSRCVWDEDYDEKPLELLYEVLIAPVQDKIQNQKEIIIIPDGDLYTVPFPALRDPKTEKCLSEIWQLRLAPSLTTLKVLQETPDEQHSKTGALIVGNPKVENVKFNGHEKSFLNLPGAESEANEIAGLLEVQPLIGESANKQAVIEKLQTGVSVIHFAAHGGNDGQIILAPPASSTNAIPEEDDYILTVQEVQQSGIRAQLVVLSCCKSGRGEIKSEGVVGMSRAFLAAGARAVVASLWAIDDKATKEFMLKFYAHLKKKESASLSLQLAMKEMRETEKYKDPKYWAAFFLIGDDVTISV